jgi:hypothetical protein
MYALFKTHTAQHYPEVPTASGGQQETQTKYKETKSVVSIRNTVEPWPVVSLHLEQFCQDFSLHHLSTMLTF